LAFFQEIQKNRYLYLMALPGLLFLLVFAYLPMTGHIIAFKRFQMQKGLWGSQWIGMENFKFFFMSDVWIKVTVNTLLLNFLFIIISLVMALIVSILLNEIRVLLFKKIAQSFIFLPYFISWIVISLMVFALFNTTDGFINRILQDMGGTPHQWFSDPSVWPAILTAVYVWKFTGYKAVIFLASISGISDDYYESARIDGATRLQQIWYITLPMLKSVIIVLTLLAIGRIFYSDFGMIYGIIGDNGVLYPTTDVIDTYSYRALRQLGNFGMASAVVLYQSVMGLITIVLFNMLVKKIDHESRLF
jgi:putative aldouronate transport system permease protein